MAERISDACCTKCGSAPTAGFEYPPLSYCCGRCAHKYTPQYTTTTHKPKIMNYQLKAYNDDRLKHDDSLVDQRTRTAMTDYVRSPEIQQGLDDGSLKLRKVGDVLEEQRERFQTGKNAKSFGTRLKEQLSK